jgi:ligand-binding sensor domain-containing protein
MQKTLRSCLFFLAVCTITVAQAQRPLAIGQWRGHLPYRLGQYVTQSEEKVFFSTEFAILEVDKTDFSTRRRSKVDGLSNIGIELIRYNPFSDVLIVVYQNGVIDLIQEDGEVVTMNQIRNFDSFAGEKRINDIHVANDSMVYLGATYGVSKINISAQEFVFTTFTGISVNTVYEYDGFLYAATAEGLYRIEVDNVNPDDFGNWQLLGPEQGMPMDYSARGVAAYDGALYVGINDSAFRYENEQLTLFTEEPGSSIQFIYSNENTLIVGFRPGRVTYLTQDGQTGDLPFNCVFTPNNVIIDERGRLWYGNEAVRTGFRYQDNINQGFCESLDFNSPWSTAVWDMSVANGQLWLASGGLTQTFNPNFLSDGFASFINGQWEIYNLVTREELRNSPDSELDDVQVFVSSAIHPSNGKVYMGSYLEGLIELDPATDEINQYYLDNSTLQIATGDARVRIGGLAFDEENNLWVANNSAPRPLSVLQPGGEWKSFSLASCGENAIQDIAVDANGFKWIRSIGASTGVLVFDEGEMDNDSDDRCRVFNTNNSELPTNDVNCVVADLDGDIWVGTNAGVVIFECGGSAFEQVCRGTKRIVEQDGFGAFLLETENVTTIAVDGANRKWVGTQNGVFLLSPSGEEQIDRFTVDNSPLFDNEIVDIAVDQQTGEVFIGTAEGLISYQSDAVAGGRTHRSDIAVYPNPVRENYEGPIAINGLARDAIVKITDITGKLVFETQALGGQAIWNGRDYNGRKVQTGVYLVFSSTNSSFAGFNTQPDAAVTKIMVIN